MRFSLMLVFTLVLMSSCSKPVEEVASRPEQQPAAAATTAADTTRADEFARAVKDVRVIGAAWYELAKDTNRFTVGQIEEGRVTRDQLASVLIPEYLVHVPQRDPWGEDYIFELRKRGELNSVMSSGFNRRSGGIAAPDEDDIVLEVGEFRSPLAEWVDVAKPLDRAMVQLRAISNAWAMRVAEYKIADIGGVTDGKVNTDRLADVLVHNFEGGMPKRDPWGEEYIFELWDHGKTYAIASAGPNRTSAGARRPDDDDIVIIEGVFMQH